MPDALITNPKGAGYFDVALNGHHDEEFVIDPAVSGSVPIGTLLEIEGFAGPGTTNPPVVPLVQPSATTADFLIIGILVGGETAAIGGTGTPTAIPPGNVGVVRRVGLARVLCDATTAVGNVLVQSTTIAGAAHPTGTAVLGKTIGVALQAVTISSGTALVYALIEKF